MFLMMTVVVVTVLVVVLVVGNSTFIINEFSSEYFSFLLWI